jgi:integrase/recombinase XerD
VVRQAREFEAQSPPIAEAVGEFLGFLTERGASINTISAYRRDLDQLIHSIESGRGADSRPRLGRAAIEEFVVDLQGQGYHEASIARKLAAARSFFVFLTAEGSVTANPTEGFVLPKVQRPLPRLVTAEEIERLLQQPAGVSREAKRDRAMLELLHATGMRVSELVSLDLANLDLDEDNPHVRCRGRRGEERTMLIPPRAREALVEYLDSARPPLLRDENVEAVFLNRRGGRLTRQGLWLILKDYAKDANLSNDITPHTLRHSFAAQMLENGVPLSNVQQLLGHSALSSTRIYYGYANNAGG